LRSYLDGRVFGELADGPGPLIVALHGWGRDHRDFRSVLDGYPHLLLDLPGFGVSPPPAAAWGAADYAACVAGVLDEHGPAQPVVLLGHSFGGRVAVCLAASRPDLVRALVLCGVPLLRSPTAAKLPAAYRLGRKAHQLGLLSDRRFEAMRRARGSRDYNAASGVMRDVLVRLVNESYDAQLAAVRCPVALLWGRADQAVPPSMVDRARGLLAGPAEAEVVDGAGHDVHLQAPDRLRAMLDRVLDAAGGVGSAGGPGGVGRAGRVPRC
jgi:pimeloyl-ACP methyl ester carboxylesterase